MSMRWPPKDPSSVLDYSVDWSRYLNNYTIDTVSWFIMDSNGDKVSFNPTTTVDGLTSAGSSNTTKIATIKTSGGTNGTTYKIVCRIVFNTNLETERTILLPVRNL